MIRQKKIGIALSGGGQRAAAFHLGVLKKLNDLGILDRIKTISAISGGSIIAAYYILNKDNFERFFEEFKLKLRINLEWRILFSRNFIWKILLLFALLASLICCFVTYSNLVFILLLIPIAIIIKYSLLIFPTGNSLQKVYDKVFYKNQKLSALPFDPKIIINTTNLQTGTLLTFSQKQIFDSSYIFKYKFVPQFDLNEVPVSFAVTASTSFAPLISPMKFPKKYIINYESSTSMNIKPELADGGIYDNQGIYKLKKDQLEIIICSDASSPYDRDKYSAINPFGLLMRTINILMKRIRSFQYISTIFEPNNLYEVAYFAIDWQYETCLENFAENALSGKIKDNILRDHQIPKEWLEYSDKEDKAEKALRIVLYMKKQIVFDSIIHNCLTSENIVYISKISTRLNGLKRKEIDLLIMHGQTLTEIQLKLYCPSLIRS